MNTTINKKTLDLIGTPIPMVEEQDRLIEDHESLLAAVQYFRQQGKKIVYTMGAYDMYHVGHARYIKKAKQNGDIVILGINSDAFLKKEKGPDRPIWPYDERWETVAYHRYVDMITVLDTRAAADELMQAMQPDVVILSFSSAKESFDVYEERMRKKYVPYCKEVKIFERQAETSTSAQVRMLLIRGADGLWKRIKKVIDELQVIYDQFKTNGGEE